MPKKPFRIVPHKLKGETSTQPSNPNVTTLHGSTDRPLLFIYRDRENLNKTRSVVEAQAVTSHIARQHRKRERDEKKVRSHSAISKILATNEEVRKGQDSSDHTIFMSDTCPHGEVMHTIPGIFITVNDCYLCLLAVEDSIPCAKQIETSLSSPLIHKSDCATDPSFTQVTYLYFKIILPWAKALQNSWHWIESIPQLQSSPMLHYAVAAYTSAFFAGLQLGARGIVLPPASNAAFDKEGLWPVPTWLRYQTHSLNLLRSAIIEEPQQAGESISLTILFHLRLAVLLGDGATAKIHFDALEQLAGSQTGFAWSKAVESSMVKVNIISAYFHSSALIFTDQEDQNNRVKYRLVDHDAELWKDDLEWYKCQNMMLARLLTWRPESPTAYLSEQVTERILQMDPNAGQLPHEHFQILKECYQLALYLIAWLTGISFDTHNPKICMYVQELVDRLHQLDLVSIWQQAPNLLFNILFAGAFASRGFLPRVWFVEQLVVGSIRVRYIHELYGMLSKFTDPGHIRTMLLEELLTEILHAQGDESCKDLKPTELYVTHQRGRPLRGQRPYTYSPDLLRIAAQQSSRICNLNDVDCPA